MLLPIYIISFLYETIKLVRVDNAMACIFDINDTRVVLRISKLRATNDVCSYETLDKGTALNRENA